MTITQHTQEAFDHWDASHYSKHSALQYGLAIEALRHGHFQQNDSVLDIGCGDGRITTEIAESLPHGKVLGIDQSGTMIEHAKQFEKDHTNLSFQQKEATDIHFNNQFQWVTSFSCLHWIENQRLVWEEIYQALVSQGKAIVLFYKRHPYLWDTIDHLMQHPQWQHYFKNFHTSIHNPEYECSNEEYVEILKSCGFHLLFQEEKTRLYDFANRMDLENFISAWLPHLSVLPQALRATFIKELCDEYFLLMPIESTGKVKMPFTHRLFIVKK